MFFVLLNNDDSLQVRMIKVRISSATCSLSTVSDLQPTIFTGSILRNLLDGARQHETPPYMTICPHQYPSLDEL